VVSTIAQTAASGAVLYFFLGKAYQSADHIQEEKEFILNIVYTCLVVFGISAAMLLSGIEAPYGRYATGASWLYGVDVEGKTAWIIQECPNMFAVAWALYFAPENLFASWESV